LDRESKIKKLHPKEPIYYLWFIGVDPNIQNKGTGSALLKDVIKQAELKNRPVYLETSTLKNLSWYKKFGFKIFSEHDFGYQLYFLKKE
jgi:ribosomal protein S18 acetylase RimI-like enzyme